MSTKRKDKKGRILRTGETQRKDGRYMYKYISTDGRDKYIYSSRLTANDPVTENNKNELSLREKIEQLKIRELKGIKDSNYTVLEIISEYLSTKVNVKYNTAASYNLVLKLLKSEAFSSIKISDLKVSDAKQWIIALRLQKGLSMSYIKMIKSLLKQAFEYALEDDLIVKNPFSFSLSNILKNNKSSSEAISQNDEDRFLDFIKNDEDFCKYYEAVYILFNTGLRISELSGLRYKDIDFKNRCIHVNHQIIYKYGEGCTIGTPKTDSSNRDIPMTQSVYNCFKSLIKERRKVKTEPIIDRYTGFIFLSKNGNVVSEQSWGNRFRAMVEKYNLTHEPKLPKITPHICRHTFCSKMAKSGMNPKTLQYIMGHSKINITLDVYTHFNFDDIKNEVKKIDSLVNNG